MTQIKHRFVLIGVGERESKSSRGGLGEDEASQEKVENICL